jgi:hypothetical protein
MARHAWFWPSIHVRTVTRERSMPVYEPSTKRRAREPLKGSRNTAPSRAVSSGGGDAHAKDGDHLPGAVGEHYVMKAGTEGKLSFAIGRAKGLEWNSPHQLTPVTQLVGAFFETT